MSDNFLDQFSEAEDAVDAPEVEELTGDEETVEEVPAKKAKKEKAPWEPTLGRSIRQNLLKSGVTEAQVLQNYADRQVSAEQIEEMDLVKWRRVHEAAAEHGVTVRQMVTAIGENRAIDPPINEDWNVWYKGRIRYVKAWCLTEEALDFLASIPKKTRAKKETAEEPTAEETGGLFGETRLGKMNKAQLVSICQGLSADLELDDDFTGTKKVMVAWILENQDSAKERRDGQEDIS